MFAKVIENGYIISIGTGIVGVEINESEYNVILQKIHSAPQAPDGYQYKLRADTLEWELVELPEPEPEEEEATIEDAFAALREVGVNV